MLTEKNILNTLDNFKSGGKYNFFIDLGHPYSYLIDTRLNIFRGSDERWAIVAEILGFNPRADSIVLEILYFGNCLSNLDKDTNLYRIIPIDQQNFRDTIDIESLKPSAEYWLVRNEKVPLSHNKQDYINAGIALKEYKPNDISAEEVGRLLIITHRQFFRATDSELYKSIPSNLQKILVLDEWYHRDYTSLYEQKISDFYINITYEVSKQHNGEKNFMDYDSFVLQYKQDEQIKYEKSYKEWEQNKPSAYETWQQIAKVIVTGDASFYKPTIKPNTHWKYWTGSGSL